MLSHLHKGSLFWDGGAAGIGKETAIQLVYRNAKVYVASRSQAKFDKLAAEVREISNSTAVPARLGHLEFLELRCGSEGLPEGGK